MPDSLQLALVNDSDTSDIYAYISGISIKDNGRRCLLQSNGKDLYFPSNPSSIGSPLEQDCAIPLGQPGNTVTVTIPQIAGGRIWICRGGRLTFLLNPSPGDAPAALVEPSVLNPSDPNANVDFGFAEFTLNNEQLYANISYVDFVPKIPIAISLRQASGQEQIVAGMPPDGIDRMAADLKQQTAQDGQPWEKLIVEKDGRILRILNATHGNAVGAGFDGYYEPLVEQVWQKYSSGAKMNVDTQAGPGVLQGHVDHTGKLKIGDEEFEKPNTNDILGCNSGPFTTGPSPARNAIIPRLAASFLRSTLMVTENHPSDPSTFYTQEPTNHYARLVHVHNVDKKGYAFAYDDVQPDGGEDQSGKVNAGDPVLFTVKVGGQSAAGGGAAQQAPPQQQQPSGDYNRGPPPPPPQEPEEEGHGLRSRIHGFAQKILK